MTFDEAKNALVHAREMIDKAYAAILPTVTPWHERHRQAVSDLQRRYCYTRSNGTLGAIVLRIDHFNPPDDPSDPDPVPSGWRADVTMAVGDRNIYPSRRADSTDYRELLRVQELAEAWIAGKIAELPASTA